MSFPRICTGLPLWVAAFICGLSAAAASDATEQSVMRTSCQCRDGVWQWVTEVVAAGETEQPALQVQQMTAEELAQLLSQREPFDGIRFQLLGPVLPESGNTDRYADQSSQDSEQRMLEYRERILVAMRDGQLTDLFGRPIRVAADGTVTNAPAFSAAAVRLEGPSRGRRIRIVMDTPADTAIGTGVPGASRGPASSIGIPGRPQTGTAGPRTPIVRGPAADTDDAATGTGEPETATVRTAQAPDRADRGTIDKKKDAPHWSVMPNSPGFASILGGVPGQGGFPAPGPSGTPSGGGPRPGGSPIPFGSPGGGGGIPGGGGGGNPPPEEPPYEPPYEPPVDPPYEPPVDPPTDPPVDPPTDPPYEPPVDPPTDPPYEPPQEPPVEPPHKPPVDPPVDPPYEPPVDPPVDPPYEPPIVCVPPVPVPEIPPMIPEIPETECELVPEVPVCGSPSDTPVVPEPGSLLALGGGMGGGAWYRRRKKTQKCPAA